MSHPGLRTSTCGEIFQTSLSKFLGLLNYQVWLKGFRKPTSRGLKVLGGVLNLKNIMVSQGYNLPIYWLRD